MTISTSHPSAVKLELTDLNILMNLLELQVDLHFKPLSSVDQLKVSESPRLNQMLLRAKEASRLSFAYSGLSSELVELTGKEVGLLVSLINASMDLRDYLGLKNDSLVNFKKRLGVDLFEQ